MADDKITMTIEAMSRTMGNAVLRERRRCAQIVADARDFQRGAGAEAAAQLLDELRETMLMPATAQIVPTPAGASTGAVEEPAEELPPVRHGDDFDDGVALARNLVRRGSGADFASGGGIGRD